MNDFSTELDRWMNTRSTGVRALARRSGYSHGYISQLRHGDRLPSPEAARDLDDTLEASGAIVQAAAKAVSRAARDRRPPALSDDLRGPVAPELVGYFKEQLPGHYKADMFLGPRHLIPAVQTQAELIINLARAAGTDVRRDLLNVGTAYAALVGWLYQDAGDLTTSAHWRDITLALAHRSGDPQLISYALTNKAMLALDLDDGHAVIDFSQAALADEHRLCPKVRVLALQHQAHGFAVLADRDTAERLLDTADTITGQVDDDYLWGNACRRTPAYVEVQRATCYGRTGRGQDAAAAADVWDQILGSMPESARRDNAVFRARQAAALAEIPEPERVTGIAAEAAELVRTTGSARLRRELLALSGHVRGWEDTPAGAELGEILASIA